MLAIPDLQVCYILRDHVSVHVVGGCAKGLAQAQGLAEVAGLAQVGGLRSYMSGMHSNREPIGSLGAYRECIGSLYDMM